MVYNLAAAYKLGLHRLTENQWAKRAINSPEKQEEHPIVDRESVKLMDDMPQETIKKRKLQFRRNSRFNPNFWRFQWKK